MIPAMVVTVLTAPHLLYRMVGSIDFPVAHLIVIDNGRCVDPAQVPWQDKVDRFSLLPMPANMGVAGSWNLGIKCSPFADYWLIANFDVIWPAGSLELFHTYASRAFLTLSAGAPPWCAFAIGEEVVQTVGLFDESLHPAYFEDNDYQTRCRAAGIPVVLSDVPVHHDNSSTLTHGYRDKNQHTFQANAEYYKMKQEHNPTSEGRWSLAIRRRNSWD